MKRQEYQTMRSFLVSSYTFIFSDFMEVFMKLHANGAKRSFPQGFSSQQRVEEPHTHTHTHTII